MSSSGKRFRRTNAQLEATWVRVEGEKRAEEDRRLVRREIKEDITQHTNTP
jgi:hypothetical protein